MTISDASPLAERAARGLRKSDWVKTFPGGRYVTTAAFMRDKRDVPRTSDGMFELSIDFLDGDHVLPQLLSRQALAPHGAAVFAIGTRVPLLDEHRSLFGFERKQEDGNVHHGHILVHQALPPPVELLIAVALAAYAEVHTR